MSNKLTKTENSSVSTITGKTNMAAILKGAVKSKLFEQLCLLVLDGSGSMSRKFDESQTKTQTTIKAVTELVNLLNRSTKSSGFFLSIISYHKNASVKLHTQHIDTVNPDEIDLGSDFGAGKATRIDRALEEAEKVAEAFLNSAPSGSQLKRTVRILLMSDGYCHNPDASRELADKFKSKYLEKIRLCTCLISNDQEDFTAAEELMKDIASLVNANKLCYTRATSGHELRQFFERSSTED
jgi:uncharacterized protein YegL